MESSFVWNLGVLEWGPPCEALSSLLAGFAHEDKDRGDDADLGRGRGWLSPVAGSDGGAGRLEDALFPCSPIWVSGGLAVAGRRSRCCHGHGLLQLLRLNGRLIGLPIRCVDGSKVRKTLPLELGFGWVLLDRVAGRCVCPDLARCWIVIR
ncbi:hypothetical protein ACLOJK_036692 [Asimina triloba]